MDCRRLLLNASLEVVTVEREPSLVAFARKHLPKNVRVEEAEIEAYLRNAAAKGKKADFIFMDLDKPMYASCYEIIMQESLLAPGGLLLCDNVLYRGLTAQHRAGEMPNVSEKVASNAASLDGFLQMVKKDMNSGLVRALMMPVRDGMLAVRPHLESRSAGQIGARREGIPFRFHSRRRMNSFFVYWYWNKQVHMESSIGPFYAQRLERSKVCSVTR